MHQEALTSLQICYSRITSVCPSISVSHCFQSQLVHPIDSNHCHLQDIVLPVETELICAQFDVVEITLLIFTEYSAERRETRSLQRDKTSIQKVHASMIVPVLADLELCR